MEEKCLLTKKGCDKMKRVAFICVHNSCRSQMAEALAKRFGAGVIEAYSGGTELRSQINQDAVRIMKDLYQIDMEESQRSKLLDELPEMDITVKMGCNVSCPIALSDYEEDWGLEDPSGKTDEEFIKTARIIEEKVKDLVKRIQDGKLLIRGDLV